MSFSGTGKIWMNGKLVEWKDATIHIASHVIHYGSGVFEGARCYATPKGSACFRLDEHLVRLINSAKIYRMEYGLDLAGWRSAVLDTIRANEMKACYIRPLIYRGYDTLGVNPLNNPVDATILLWEWGAYLGAEALEQGVDMKVSSWSRMAPNTLPAGAKATANYANSALIKMEALADGYSEGIALDVYGNVSEDRDRTSSSCATERSTRRRSVPRSSAASRAIRSPRSRATSATPSWKRTCRARCCTSPTKSSSSAPRPK
jgi:branched-chain amino acid aminotransferase